jgi:hypothetical protein
MINNAATYLLKHLVIIPTFLAIFGTIIWYSFVPLKDKPKFLYSAPELVLPSSTDPVLQDITIPAKKNTNSPSTNKVVTTIVPLEINQRSTKDTNVIPYVQENITPPSNLETNNIVSLPLSPASFPVAYTCPYWLYRNPAVARPVSDTTGY